MWCRTGKFILLVFAGLLSTNCLGEIKSKEGKSPLDTIVKRHIVDVR